MEGQDRTPPSGYRWVCPICGDSGVLSESRAPAEAHVKNALRSHIQAKDDEGHGSRGCVPDTVDDTALTGAVSALRNEYTSE